MQTHTLTHKYNGSESECVNDFFLQFHIHMEHAQKYFLPHSKYTIIIIIIILYDALFHVRLYVKRVYLKQRLCKTRWVAKCIQHNSNLERKFILDFVAVFLFFSAAPPAAAARCSCT